MSEKFQCRELTQPLMIDFLLASGASTPLFITRHWILGIFSTILMFIGLRAMYGTMMRYYSEARNGGRYIAPTLQSAAEMKIAFCQFLSALFVFVMLAYLTDMMKH